MGGGKCKLGIFGGNGLEEKEKNRERIGDLWVRYGKERYTKYIVIKMNYKNVN